LDISPSSFSVRDVDRRAAAHDDPVMAHVSALLGATVVQLDLLVALAFSIVLDRVDCLCWWIVSQSWGVRAQTQESRSGVMERITETGVLLLDDPDALRVQAAIAEGKIGMTVSSIRVFGLCPTKGQPYPQTASRRNDLKATGG
jgi:hypothetical protein